MAFLVENDLFNGAGTADILQYGEKYSPMYGVDTVEITKEQANAFLNGAVLFTTVNDEYGILIRVKPDVESCVIDEVEKAVLDED